MFPSLPITPFGILTAIGFVIASFLFWRRLKEDFPEEEIFTLTLWLALGGLLVSRLAYVILHSHLFIQNPPALFFWGKYPGFSLLGAVLGILGTLGYFGKKKDWDIWIALDALVPVCLVIFVLGSFGAYLSNREIFYLTFPILGVSVLLIKKFCLVNYRSFSFYPSGKVGFLGLSSMILFFSLILPLDFYKKSVLSLEAIGFLVIIVVALGFLYQRSGRKIKEDLKMKNPIPTIKFPAKVLNPVRLFLRKREKELEEKKKSLSEQDPFADPKRLKDSAASDADAQEQVGHAQVEALKREIDRKLIQIRKALTRIRVGHYGTCESCGKMINTERLMVSPEATRCIKCERKGEKS